MEADKSNNFGYNPNLKELAAINRKKATKAEACLWKYALSRKQSGLNFKRQRPVLNYIADFMCQELRLIIEVDGSSHNQEEVIVKDIKRQKELESFGFIVLRFTNEEVLDNMDDVRRVILETTAKLGVRESPSGVRQLEALTSNLPSHGIGD